MHNRALWPLTLPAIKDRAFVKYRQKRRPLQRLKTAFSGVFFKRICSEVYRERLKILKFSSLDLSFLAEFAFKFEQKFTSKFKQLRLDGKSEREICENLDNEAQAAKFELKI